MSDFAAGCLAILWLILLVLAFALLVKCGLDGSFFTHTCQP